MFIDPNDPYYPEQWAHQNTGQAVSYNGGNVGTPDSDTDTDLAWDITQGSEDIIIAIVDTNANPDPIDYIIPGNDDAIRSINLYASFFRDTAADAKEIIRDVESEKNNTEINDKDKKENQESKNVKEKI